MFLLLGTQYHNYSLSELFTIKQGHILPTKNKLGITGKYRYKVIYPSDFNSVRRQVDITKLDDYFCEKKIGEDKILTSDDFIISCKGTIKGYSLFHSKKEIIELAQMGYCGLITSNQCITFKPMSTAKSFYKSDYYLHNILELLIPVMNNISGNKEKSSSINYITINDVSKISVSLPVSVNNSEIEEFNNVFNDWKDKYLKLQEAEKGLEDFNNKLRKRLHSNDL